MGKETDIQWCDSTVNITGFQCDGCELWNSRQNVRRCYAGRWAERIGGRGTFDQPVELRPGRMATAANWSDLRGQARPDKPWMPKELPRLIFIGDMADTLSAAIPFTYLLDEVLKNVASDAGRRHTWLWLTKRPSRLAEFSAWAKKRGHDWPENLWPGTSITSRKTLKRINQLLGVGNLWTNRFLSIEPLWENIVGTVCEPDFQRGLEDTLAHVSYVQCGEHEAELDVESSYIHWVITGGESGPQSNPCHLEWIQEIIDLCRNACLDNTFDGEPVPCFVKQLGSNPWVSRGNKDYSLTFLDKKGGDLDEWPEDLRVRQFPKFPC